MRLVVDASVIVQISVAGGSLGPLEDHDLFAPPLLISDVTSILSELTFRGEIPADQARIAVERFVDLPITIDRPPGLALAAWDIARSLGWAKTYDAEYVALAQHHDVALITIDQRMRRAVGHLVDVPDLEALGG
jgi:predicted nucleic acid-binding protein